MSEDYRKDDNERVTFEEAINKTGFGVYNYMLTCLAGINIISFACIAYGSTMIVPTSACELGTTTAQQGLLASGPIVGGIIGGIMWGYLSDTRGRRKMLVGSLISGAVVNTLASFSVNWIMLLILQFLGAMLTSGLYSMSMSLLSESVPMMKRNMVVLMVTSIFLLSQGLMAVVAIPIIPLTYSYHIPGLNIYFNSWRTLMLLYGVPAIVAAVWQFFMQESPKFVLVKGDEDQALEILRTIHRINNGSKGGEFPVKGLEPEVRQVQSGPSSPKDQVFPLFKPPLLKYTIIISMLFFFQQLGAFGFWLPTITNRFVPILETGEGVDMTLCDIIRESMDSPQEADPNIVPCSLNTTSMLLVLAVGAIQSAVNLMYSFIVNYVGRRNLVIVTTAICGTGGILVNLVPNAIASAVFFVLLLQGITVLGLYTAITLSIFPTQLRTMAVTVPMLGGRIISFASVQVLNLLLATNCDVGFYVFASLFASSAIVASFLPDDRRSMQKPAHAPQGNEEIEQIRNETFRDSKAMD